MSEDIWSTYEWYPVPDAAERLGITAKAVRALLKDRSLLAIRQEPSSPLLIAGPFLTDESGNPALLESLKGTVTFWKSSVLSPSGMFYGFGY